MSNAAGPVSAYLRDRVTRLLRDHRVVVWYDPERAFTSFFETLELDSTTKLVRGEAYFRLREEAEQVTSTFRHGEAAPRSLLVYVPEPRLPTAENLLLPLERLGIRVARTLREEASMALRNSVPQTQRNEWFSVEGLTLSKLDELARAGTEIGSLAVVFGEVTPAQVAWKLLSDLSDSRLLAIEAAKQVTPLRDLLVSEFGVRFPEHVRDACGLRDAFAERILLYEFLDDLEEVPDALKSFRLPGRAGRLALCRDLAARLRDSRSAADSYARWATASEKTFRLATLEYDAQKLGRYFTFPFEERLALRHVHELASGERWDEAQRWVADQQRDSFWLRYDKERGGQWRVAELAVELWLAASEQLRKIPEADGPESWIRAYSRDPAGCWLPDQLARKLAALRTVWLDQAELGEIAQMALSRARELERRWAERFTDAVAAQPEGLTEVALQLDVFDKRVAPLLARDRRVALVLADALRFEMAQELSQMLEDSGQVTLDAALATLPTLTKIGMAALVPGAGHGLDLAEQGQRVIPVMKGVGRLRNLADRRARYTAAYGDRVGEITLDDCIGATARKLQNLVERSDLLLLLSQDLDEVGETDRVYRAADLMSRILDNLHRCIRRLSNAGVQEFVVVADHGFLLRDDITDAMKIDKPGGELVEERRRCVLGRDLAGGDHHIVLKSADLGLGGDLELAFPRGVNVFKVSGGSLAYLHGGLSIQECLVPVLEYVPKIADPTSGRPTLHVKMLGERITNRYFPVVLSYSADLFGQDQSRRFRVDLISGDESVGRALAATVGYREEAGNAIQLGSGEESTVTMGITGDLEGAGELELRVFDAELGETVKRLKVRYELAF